MPNIRVTIADGNTYTPISMANVQIMVQGVSFVHSNASEDG